MHGLAARLRDAAHGRFPPADGAIEVMPSPGPPCDAIVGFTGHFVLAADVDPGDVAARMPAGDFSVPFSPASLQWIAAQVDRVPATYDALLVSIADATGAPSWLHPADDLDHPRIDRASRFRTIEGVWADDQGAGLLIVGRGLCGRWEVGYEIAADARDRGLGRRLVGAARHLAPAGEPLWAQVAPGNAASLRATLAAGFVPVAAEVLFIRGQ